MKFGITVLQNTYFIHNNSSLNLIKHVIDSFGPNSMVKGKNTNQLYIHIIL